MRTYLILKERAERWNADAEIQALVKEAQTTGAGAPALSTYSAGETAMPCSRRRSTGSSSPAAALPTRSSIS